MNIHSADDTKEQIRNATDIVDLIGGYMNLRRQGRLFVGSCPWHDDSRPSLQVNPERQSWKCWVCDIGGDVFSFVMKRESLDFREALEMLAERAGIVLQRSAVGPSGIGKNSLFKVLSWAEKQFADFLADQMAAAPAREYLAKRGISDESARQFRVGYSPNEWDWLLQRARRESFSDELLQLAGLTSFSETSKRTYDRFRGRLLFSIRDEQGRTVGFGGRVLPSAGDDSGPKYVNSPETRLFSKSELLYALDAARDEVQRTRHVIVVEGYTDAMMAHQAGIRNVVAVLGTALGPRHLRLLQRYADRVTLLLDGDDAGQRRTNDILELFLKHSMDLRIATIPNGRDPCDLLIEEGPQPFRDLVEQATDALFHRIRVATAGIDIARDLHGANRALEQILASLASMGTTGVKEVSQVQLKQRQVLAYLSRLFDVPEPDLRARLRVLRQSQPEHRGEQHRASSNVRPQLNDWDRALLELCVIHPQFTAKIAEQIDETELQTDEARLLFRLLAQLAIEEPTFLFHDAMLRIDDPRLKSLLVELDEQGANKAELQNRPTECLHAVLDAFDRRRIERECRTELKRMESQSSSEEDQLEALEQILKHRRSQQGI